MRFCHFAFAIIILTILYPTSSEVPELIAYYLIGMNGLTFALYAFDKLMALQGFLRVPERLLLVLTAVGGVVGGSAAQSLFNHKIAKTSFQVRYAISSAIALTLLWVLLKH